MTAEQLGLVEALVDGDASYEEVELAIELMAVGQEERDALALWAWAWAESRPRGLSALRQRLSACWG